MNYNRLKKLVVATAAVVNNDELAYQLVLRSFIGDHATHTGGLIGYIEERCASGEVSLERTSPLELLVEYSKSIFSNPQYLSALSELVYSDDVRSAVITRLYDYTESENYSELISRPDLVKAIRDILARENMFKNISSSINVSRIMPVISMFKKWYCDNCAQSFEGVDSFKSFVCNAFKAFFYESHKRDIWRIISGNTILTDSPTDSLLHHLEDNGVKVGGEFYIRNHLQNIQLANETFLLHHGRVAENHGYIYEVFYLIITLLCAEYTEKMNDELKQAGIEYEPFFVDMRNCGTSTPEDGSSYLFDPSVIKQPESEYDLPEVVIGDMRGVSTKISNLGIIVSKLLKVIRSGDITPELLNNVRQSVFNANLKTLDATQTFWVISNERFPYSSLNVSFEEAATNYQRFDIILKAVMSSYALMKEMSNRGISIIDTYRSDMFLNTNITRYLDYMSSIKYIDRILALQSAPDEDKDQGDLSTFEQMLSKYIASPQNTNSERRNAVSCVRRVGFYRGTKLKSNVPAYRRINNSSDFEIAACLSSYLNALPSQKLNLSDDESERVFKPRAKVPINRSRFDNNWFIIHSNLETIPWLSLTADDIHPTSWNLTESQLPSITIYNTDCSFIVAPFSGVFYDGKSVIPLFKAFESTATCMVTQRTDIDTPMYLSATIPSTSHGLEPTNNTIAFNSVIGYTGISSSQFIESIEESILDKELRHQIANLIDEYGFLGELQIAIVDFVESILSQLYFYVDAKELTDDNTMSLVSDMLSEISTGYLDVELWNNFISMIYQQCSTYLTERDNELQALSNAMQEVEAQPQKTNEMLIYQAVIQQSFQMISARDEHMENTLDILNLIVKGTSRFRNHSMCSNKFIEPAMNFDSPALRFIALFDIVSTYTELITVLRDSYRLVTMLSFNDNSLSSFICDIDSKLNVSKTLGNLLRVNPSCILPTSDSENVLEVVRGLTTKFTLSYKPIISKELKLIESAADSLAILTNTERNDVEVQSQLSKYGNLFASGIPPEVPKQFKELLSACKTDSAGFLLFRNKYVYAVFDKTRCFVHKTGNVLTVDKLVPLPLQLHREELPIFKDKTLYEQQAYLDSLPSEEQLRIKMEQAKLDEKLRQQQLKYWSSIEEGLHELM